MQNGITSSIFIVVSITAWLMFFIVLIYGFVVMIRGIHKEVKDSRSRKESEYNLMYGAINARLKSYEINQNNYHVLKSQIEILGSLKHKDHDRTNALLNTFVRRFGKEYNQDLLNRQKRIA